MGKKLAPALSQELQITYHHSRLHKNGVNVVLTAFEPFVLSGSNGGVEESDDNLKTSSWESIRLLTEKDVQFRRPVNIHCYQLRNIYDFIGKQILRCWEKHCPDLVIITGNVTDCGSNEIVFEEVANNSHHILLDQLRRLPMEQTCCTYKGPSFLRTKLDLITLGKRLCATHAALVTRTSETYSGFYLCDYAYYNSLLMDSNRSACIRVPGGNSSTSEDIVDGLSFCVSELLQQLDNNGLVSTS